MSEEKARSDAEALALALGITFFIVRSDEGLYSAVQQPPPECEIIAAIEPPVRDKRLFDELGFGEISHQD
jgi:hypothetical protein